MQRKTPTLWVTGEMNSRLGGGGGGADGEGCSPKPRLYAPTFSGWIFCVKSPRA